MDAHPLSPLQASILVKTVAGSPAGGQIEQLVLTLAAAEPGALRRAWEQVTARHAALRTRIRWEGEPRQEVADSVTLPWTEEDWRGADAQRLSKWLVEDRQRGLSLDSAPLFRLTLFRLTDSDYRLVWTFHHIILDGRSIAIVLEEVLQAYEGKPLPPPPTLSSRDYIEWIARQDRVAARAYFQELCAGTQPARLNLTPPATATGQTEAETLLDASMVASLQRLAAGLNVTMNTLVQGAWALLLARYTGGREVQFGATRACRHWTPGAEALVGFFINTLPVRVQVEPSERLGSFLERLRAQHLAIRPHEHASLADLRDWSGAPGDTPLFESVVVFEDQPLGNRTGRTVRLYEQTNLPLALAAYLDSSLRLVVEFDDSRYDPDVIRQFLGHLVTILVGMLAGPETLLGDLPLLSASERQRLLVEWNATNAPIPACNLHQLIEEQVDRTPAVVAVEEGDRRWTYQELNAQANGIAALLVARGIGRGMLVGICLGRTLELVAALLGVLKAGAAYVPLDPDYPTVRLSAILADARPALVLVQADLENRIPAGSIPILTVQPGPGAANPPPTATADDLAYVIYTSGTTGTPRGVPIHHRAVVNLVGSVVRAYPFRAGDRLLQTATINFDAAVEGIFGMLACGGTLIMATREMIASTTGLTRVIHEYRVNVLDMTTAHWHEWVSGLARLAKRVPAELRLVVVGGDKASAAILTTWYGLGGDAVRWVNSYGPTETCVTACAFVVPEATPLPPGQEIPIGRPLHNTRLYLLDDQQQPVPTGAPGELYIGGAGVSRGYLNQPGQTAQKFVPDPFAPGTLYRTGDLARYRPDGEMEFLGRTDFQVKVRGFRIELSEIEIALERHPEIVQAVVVTRGDSTGEKQIVAYVIARRSTPDKVQLRNFLQTLLPEYMLPAHVVFLDAIPLTPAGKVDRRRLPEPAAGSGLDPADLPRTPVEEQLAQIWCSALRLTQVGIHQNFFELGGHSLLTIQVIDRAQKAGLDIKPHQFFQNPTIAGLSEAIARSAGDRSDGTWSSLVPLRDSGSGPPLYLVHSTPGDLLGYGGLVHHLGAEHACWGFQSLGLDDPARAHSSIGQMATYYVELLQAHRRTGPYHLGGWCYGGIVAMEMARQLQAKGEQIGLLALIDAYAPHSNSPLTFTGRRRIAQFLRMGPAGWLRYLCAKYRTLRKSQQPNVEAILHAHFSQGPLANRETVYRLNLEAVNVHRAAPYRGKITLFNSAQQPEEILPDPQMGWGGLVEEIETHIIPGSHTTILKVPGVRTLAERLSECMNHFNAP